MGAYCPSTYVRDLEGLPCKSLSDSIRAPILQSFWGLHRELKVGMQCLQSRERHNSAAASALATAAPLMLRHSDCSGQ